MLYMLIERYRAGARPVYERAADHGRMLPEGLRYIDSWVVDDENLDWELIVRSLIIGDAGLWRVRPIRGNRCLMRH